ncbi:MAG: B12-binding domain-containing radical SAM protein [Clostridiales Family XIII bacterium]|jgi:radical SAM superfamily enzyme YgiQ (UPF0313 family)|nr:B12-binding domain-containing radical SAM protein [Clostridiales Family XIII bacterium]
MAKIAFIAPCTAKLHGGHKNTIYDSKLFRLFTGKQMALFPKLSGLVFAALTPERHSFVYIEDELDEIDFDMDVDIVALSVLTEQAYRAYEIAGEFRRRGKPVVMGGVHASVVRQEAAAHCDVLMIGEGENTWLPMLEDFENGCLKPVYDAKDYPPVTALTSPKADVVQHDRYTMFVIQATRGCPYDCDFCSLTYTNRRHYRKKPVEQVVAEIKEYEKHNIDGHLGMRRKNYYFVDDNLYVDREYVKELLTALIPLGITWEGQGTVNTASDDEILELMAKSGCRAFSVGFESIQPESLREVNKAKVNTVETYEACIRNMARHGIMPGGYFIFGFDSDDVGVFERTWDFLDKSELLLCYLNVLTPYPGTRLYDRLEPRIYNYASNNYNSWTCVFTPKLMSSTELQRGATWAAKKMMGLDYTFRQLKKFWNQGPWEAIPTLNLAERLTLIGMGLVLGFTGGMEYLVYTFKCAFYPKAADIKEIFWFMRRREMADYMRIEAVNPALAKKKKQLAN